MLTRYRTFSAAILATVSVAVPYGSRLLAQDLLQGWTASQKTGAVVLVKVKEGPVGTTLSLKSVSGKLITAIAASSPPSENTTYRHFYDYLDSSSAGLANGATYELRISPQEAASNVQRVLEIDAVIFEDGTAEGLQGDVDFMNAKRLGRVFETERLRSLLARPDAQPTDLETLAGGIGTLPNSVEEALASLAGVDLSGLSLAKLRSRGGTDNQRAFLSGVRHTREEALWKVKETQELPETSADPGAKTRSASILALKQAYEEKTGMYRGLGQRLLGRLPQ
jgi:hypothetical protein